MTARSEPGTVPGDHGSGRLPGLDLLRAAAISWVLLYHATLFDLVPKPGAAAPVVAFGWMGVDLFFVLSGYLIGGQLFRPLARGERLDFGGFYLRRALRTLPAYLVVVAVYFLWPGLREWPDIQPLWRFLSFTANLALDISRPKTFSHVWSLCVEEQFYLVFPMVVALLALRPRAWKVIAAAVAVLVLGMLLRWGIWLHFVGPHEVGGVKSGFSLAYLKYIYYPTWTRLDDLLGGAMVAALRVFRPRLWTAILRRANLMLVAGIGGVALSIRVFGGEATELVPAIFAYPLLAGSLSLIVAAGASERSVIGRYAVPGARSLAMGAYSLYLSHKIVFHLVQVHLSASLAHYPCAAFGVALFAALVLGAALYWLVERPFLKLRDRLGGRARTARTAAAIDPAAA